MTTALIELDAKNTITVTMGKERLTLNVEADCDSGDLNEDMESIAGTIAWYTQVLAAARKHCDLVEAGYRAWQAKQLKEYIDDDPKVAEWKAKSALNQEPAFMEWKAKQADAWELVNRLDGAVRALTIKADMLRSRGAMIRTEITHLDRSLPGPAATRGDDHGGETVDAKGERLRQRLRGDD